MLNRCDFIGNVGRDPEIRALQNGDEVANLSLGVSARWKDQSGKQQERTEWVRVVVFGGLVNVVKNYVKKGSHLFISGKLQTRKWTDQSGQEKYSTEIVLQGYDAKLIMLDTRKADDFEHQQEKQNGYQPQADLDDALPF